MDAHEAADTVGQAVIHNEPQHPATSTADGINSD